MIILSSYSAVVSALHDERLSSGLSAPKAKFTLKYPEPHIVETNCDLVNAFLEPWCLTLAEQTVGAPSGLGPLAREVFDAASEARNAPQAVLALAQALPGPLQVQAFVALSQTLPCFLAGAWRLLLEDPELSLEELLRLAGPAQLLFRTALFDVTIENTFIPRGSRVTLCLAEANRDPNRAPGSPHLAFGAGLHACTGASLVRNAALVATPAFLRCNFELAGPVVMRPGAVITGPATLPVGPKSIFRPATTHTRSPA